MLESAEKRLLYRGSTFLSVWVAFVSIIGCTSVEEKPKERISNSKALITVSSATHPTTPTAYYDFTNTTWIRTVLAGDDDGNGYFWTYDNVRLRYSETAETQRYYGKRYTRVSELEARTTHNNNYGYAFFWNGTLIKRGTGWCATPPVTFFNFPGSYEIFDKANNRAVLVMEYDWFDEMVEEELKIVFVDEKHLVLTSVLLRKPIE
jgi:hypothetical protein